MNKDRHIDHTEALEIFSGVSRFRLLGMCMVLQECIPCRKPLHKLYSEELISWLDTHFVWNQNKWIPKVVLDKHLAA